MLGGIVGFGALLALVPNMGATAGCTATALPPVAAAAVEALLTGSLVLIAAGLWAEHDDARPDVTVPIKLGLAIAGLVYAGVSTLTSSNFCIFCNEALIRKIDYSSFYRCSSMLVTYTYKPLTDDACSVPKILTGENAYTPERKLMSERDTKNKIKN